MSTFHLRGLRDVAVQPGIRRDQLRLAAVPLGQDLGGGRASQDARVDEAGEAHVRDMSRGAEDALKVPDGFGAVDP